MINVHLWIVKNGNIITNQMKLTALLGIFSKLQILNRKPKANNWYILRNIIDSADNKNFHTHNTEQCDFHLRTTILQSYPICNHYCRWWQFHPHFSTSSIGLKFQVKSFQFDYVYYAQSHNNGIMNTASSS
jgi:hypothetical protein